MGGGSKAPPLQGGGQGGVSNPCRRPIGPIPNLSPEGEGHFGAAALSLIGVMARVAGWRPGEFWSATPADARAVLAGWIDADADPSFDRAALAAMMEQFPDG